MSNYKSYFLKSLGLKEDSLPGGKGDETKPTNVSPEQLEMGIKVEMEHTNDRNLAREIALDHLTEDPNYYTSLKKAGMADELPGGKKGEVKEMTPMMSKLISPTAIMPTPVIGMAVRGTKTGNLPAGGIVGDPERARLGGFEPVQNLKPNSQGAIADTPENSKIESSGGHYTPKNPEISEGGCSKPSSDKEQMHPMQVQQLGNKPIDDDGTTRDGKTTPEAAKAGVGDEGGSESSAPTEPSEPAEEPEEHEPKTGAWGIPMDSEKSDGEEEEGGEEEGEDIEIDVKEDEEKEEKESKKPWEKEEVKESLENRFKKLANIKEVGAKDPHVQEFEMDKEKAGMVKKEAGALSELKKMVAEMKAKGKKGPMLERAEKYLSKQK